MSQFTIGVHDAENKVHQLDIGLEFNAQARTAGAAHAVAHADNLIQTRPDQPTARQQIYAQLGLNRKNTTLESAMSASMYGGYSAAAVQDASITGRLVTQAYLMDVIENKLLSNDYGIAGLFTRKAAVVDSINGTKFDRPILNFSKPEGARSKAIAQLSEPTSMLLLTTSGTSYQIPGTAIGLEYSDQAAANVSLPIVALSMARQAEVEGLERVEAQLLAFMNGDVDLGMAALSGASVKNAKADFDTSLTVAGTLSQKAWVGWLFNNSRSRKIDTIVTNLAGALAIEARSGRPTVQGDNATSSRIDTLESVINPTWPDKVEVIISQDPNWPANKILGFDSTYGYHIVNSTSMSYSGTESFAIRRSTKMRVDSGSIAYRLFDDAWSVLTLTVA